MCEENLEEYITDETEDVRDESQDRIEYGEVRQGKLTLMYHPQDLEFWKSRDEWIIGGCFWNSKKTPTESIYKIVERPDEEEALKIVRELGWSYIE